MKHILHVEDDSDFHFYVDAMLSDFVNTTSVCTAKEFKGALTAFTFDLFLLDIVLKDGSGVSIAKQCRAQYPDIPIVILSAHDAIFEIIEDVDAIFDKSVLNYDEFIAKIKSLLN